MSDNTDSDPSTSPGWFQPPPFAAPGTPETIDTSLPPLVATSGTEGTPGLAPLSSNMRGLLNVIAGPESGGRYNVRYDGSPTGATFDGYDQHPNVASPIPGTKLVSTAAGRYQFINSTWNQTAKMLGLKDFSPQSQDQGAAYLANRTYKTATGRDLEADLNDPSKYGQIADALHSQWPSITSANIAAGFGGNAPTTQVAAATPAPQAPAATPTTPPINPQLQQLRQLQRLSLMSKLLQPQQQAPVPTNQQFLGCRLFRTAVATRAIRCKPIRPSNSYSYSRTAAAGWDWRASTRCSIRPSSRRAFRRSRCPYNQQSRTPAD